MNATTKPLPALLLALSFALDMGEGYEADVAAILAAIAKAKGEA